MTIPEHVHVPGLGDVRTELLIGGAVTLGAAIAFRDKLSGVNRDSNLYQGISMGLILAPQVPGIFASPNPSKMTIATFEHIPAHMQFWIHAGNKEAVAQCFLLGLGGSLLTGSWVPFVMVMAITIWKVISYEDALQGGENGGPRYDMRDRVRTGLGMPQEAMDTAAPSS